ncbi:MAG: penicillin-binding transpeptidase domain-containing protein [Acidobacteriota bacterium]
MPVQSRQQYETRVYILLACCVTWSFLIAFRLVNFQILRYVELSERARRQQSRSFEISPKRGSIFDRKGRELAVSITLDSVYAVSSEIEDKQRTASQLAKVLKLNQNELLKRLNGTRGFSWVKRKVDLDESRMVASLGLTGVYFEKESKRFYPKRELAAHVLGYVGMDNEGLASLEYAYEDEVGGKPGRVSLLTDARNRSYSSIQKPPMTGKDLVLTIDETIQYLVERELAEGVRTSNALGGSVIVMDPQNGEILALANYPSYNPNHHTRYSPEVWKNRAILSIYEPGSTFKIITAATALEERLARPDESIPCLNGAIVVGGRRIRDHKPYGFLTFREVVAYSSNIGAIQLGFRIGKDRFERYIRRFGFGQPTEIDLPGEAKGILHPASQWPTVTLANIAMGQGIGVTPLQVVTAVSAVANGGTLVRPHVVKEIHSSELQQVASRPQPERRRILSDRTTTEIRQMLSSVVTTGTGKTAQLEGFTAAGKTGTAQKVEANGRYSHTRFIASFVGFAPIEHPAMAVVVTIDEPKGRYYGGEVAAPIFRSIAERTLRYLSVRPDQPLLPKQLVDRAQLENQRGNEELERRSAIEDWLGSPPAQAVDWSEAASPAETEAQPGYQDTVLGRPNAVQVPDFLGKSFRATMAEAAKLGLSLKTVGSGRAIEQHPLPGSRVAANSTVSVRFSRHQSGQPVALTPEPDRRREPDSAHESSVGMRVR